MPPRIARNLLLFSTFFSAVHSVHSQTTAAPPAASARPAHTSIEPGPKPPDAAPEWKQLVGIYTEKDRSVIVLERDGSLSVRYLDTERAVQLDAKDSSLMIPMTVLSDDASLTSLQVRVHAVRNRYGDAVSLNVGDLKTPVFSRTDAGSDPSHYYHITPVKPIDQLRTAALAVKPPPETHPFRRPDLVELVTLDPSVHLDIRYAQSNNFLSTPVYTQARAFMQRPAAEALLRTLHRLQPLGYGLLIHDAYRPWYVTKIFWDATPPEGKRFVADPKEGSKHNRGCAVDLTLYDLATGKPVEMPGLYDEMSPRSFPNFPGGTSLQRWHRDLLRRAMESQGFTVNESEWWHFDYRDWTYYQIMNVPFEDLGVTAPATTSVH